MTFIIKSMISVYLISVIQCFVGHNVNSFKSFVCLIDDKWFRLDDRTCIHLSEQKLNYEQSKNYCKHRFSSNRLIIQNDAKQKSINNYLLNLSHKTVKFGRSGDHELKFWIGLNRIKLKQDRSVLLFDDEMYLYVHLIDEINNEINKSNRTDIKSNEHEIKDQIINESFKPNQTNRDEVMDDHYKRMGLINLKKIDEFNGTQSSTGLSKVSNLLIKKEKLLNTRHILFYDNRFRDNEVDSFFYITNKTDKWKMSFSSIIKLFTICELPIDHNGELI